MCVHALQKERFLLSGWENADALDMMTVYGVLPQVDVARYVTLYVFMHTCSPLVFGR